MVEPAAEIIPLISLQSLNIKTGPIPTISRPQTTCPDDCPAMNMGCYGENNGAGGRPSQFAMVAKAAFKFSIRLIAEMAPAKWAPAIRFNVVGDYFREDGTPDLEYIADTNYLAKARPWVPISYTHGWRRLRPDMFDYVVRASTETREGLEEAIDAGWRTTLIDPGPEDPNTLIGQRVRGQLVIQCPATNGKAKNCADCRLCGRDLPIVVAFPGHGQRKGLINRMVDMYRNAQPMEDAA
jgi:hypothetical protein